MVCPWFGNLARESQRKETIYQKEQTPSLQQGEKVPQTYALGPEF